MKIELKSNMDRKDSLFVIKNLSTGRYLDCQWTIQNGQEVCTWVSEQIKLVKVSSNQSQAEHRLKLARLKIQETLAIVKTNPPSQWRTDNIQRLTDLLNADIRVVQVSFELKSQETLV